MLVAKRFAVGDWGLRLLFLQHASMHQNEWLSVGVVIDWIEIVPHSVRTETKTLKMRLFQGRKDPPDLPTSMMMMNFELGMKFAPPRKHKW